MYSDHRLDRAIKLAHQAHDGQVDKAGIAYIQHPLRVMHQMTHIDAKIVAILHDTLEDTWVTALHLHTIGLNTTEIDALYALTKQPHENRFAVLKRTLLNSLACEVKRADVYDNMNLARLTYLTQKDLQRYQEYRQIYLVLQQACEFYQRSHIKQHINIAIEPKQKRLIALAVKLYNMML